MCRGKKIRDKAWKKLKKQRNKIHREQYKEARNEYIRIRRGEERVFEKDVVEKCEKEPKLFYRYINVCVCDSLNPALSL